MSSQYFSLFFPEASSSSQVVVTPEEFNAFHSIDRIFFSRLVFVLNRDRNQSLEVFSFLFMLEQSGYARSIISYLVSSPVAFINLVANEVVVCLNFIHNFAFATAFFVANTNDDHNSVIPLISQMTRGKLTLRFIHHNRETFLEGLQKNMTDICSRAFNDIWGRAEMYVNERRLALEREKAIEEMQKLRLTQQGSTSRLSVHQGTPSRSSIRQETIAPSPLPRPPVEEETIKTTPGVIETNQDENVVLLAPDDRTVFLTFSKGYPITEEEVKVYFTRRFGDVIEVILMQEVEMLEQPLFARMVLKNSCVLKMEEIVTLRNRNKFTINGKHVWARKYVPKSGASASSSQI